MILIGAFQESTTNRGLETALSISLKMKAGKQQEELGPDMHKWQDLLCTIVLLAKKGDTEAREFLIKLPFIQSVAKLNARRYYTELTDPDDLYQEAMIALIRSLGNFNPDKSDFYKFARMCIQRRIMTLVKDANRLKRKSKGTLDLEDLDEADLIPAELIADISGNCLYSASLVNFSYKELRERFQFMQSDLSLSELEYSVLLYRILEKDYAEIAVLLKCSAKAVDNALMRIKRKIPPTAANRRMLGALFSATAYDLNELASRVTLSRCA